MAKKPRKLRAREQEKPAESPVVPAKGANIVRVLRCRCILCGMLPEFERFMGGPYPLDARMQTFGGNKNMSYLPVDDEETLSQYREVTIRKLEQALKYLKGE